MAHSLSWRDRRRRFIHRAHARRAAQADITTRFTSPPEPRSIGLVARGKQLITGRFLFSGLLVESPDRSIWDIADRNPLIMEELQGCGWLDDLEAVGTESARTRAQTWVFGWIDRYGDGNDAGWTPGTTGRRLIRWINHADFILRGQPPDQEAAFLQSLARQTLFLSRRWQVMPPGLPQLQALAGIIYAGRSLDGMAQHVEPAMPALGRLCETRIAADGGVATRNPEELLETLGLLNLCWQALSETGWIVPGPLLDAIERIAPTLRALRHADGGLARFQGGGRGIEGHLDAALAASGIKALPGPGLHMGFARLSGGRTTVIVDAAAPPAGPASANAHASTLAFELTSGRRPVIVNCGSGARFGEDWRRASRATPSHSTFMIDGVSSSRMSPKEKLLAQDDLLTDLPAHVTCAATEGAGFRQLEMSHDGYRPSHGLTHQRNLRLSTDGRSLIGVDMMTTQSHDDDARFDAAARTGETPGIGLCLRFHLHPDVVAAIDADALQVTLNLKSGERWILRGDEDTRLSLEPSVYLENGKLRPTSAQQVVFSGRTMSYATRVRWSLAKTDDTPDTLRDLA